MLKKINSANSLSEIMIQAEDHNSTENMHENIVLASESSTTNVRLQRDIGDEPWRVIASWLPKDFLSLRRINRASNAYLSPVWVKDVFYDLCKAALTDGEYGRGYRNGNKARVKYLLDLAAGRSDKSLLRQLLTMQITSKSRRIKEYGAHCPKGTLYGMLLKRCCIALNKNDKGMVEIVADFYTYLDDGKNLRQREHDKIFPKSNSDDSRSVIKRIEDTFKEQKPFDFRLIINAINSASEDTLRHQIKHPRNTDTTLGMLLEEFRSEFSEVSFNEEIFNPQHYLHALEMANKHITPYSFQDTIFSSQVFGTVQLNMPTHLLHAHAQGLYNISSGNKRPSDSPYYDNISKSHIVFGRNNSALGRLGENYFAVCCGIGTRVSRTGAWKRDGAAGLAHARKFFSSNTNRLLKFIQQRTKCPRHSRQSNP